ASECSLSIYTTTHRRHRPTFPTRRSSDLSHKKAAEATKYGFFDNEILPIEIDGETLDHDEPIRPDTSMEALSQLKPVFKEDGDRSEEHTSELQSRFDLVCRLLLEKKNNDI